MVTESLFIFTGVDRAPQETMMTVTGPCPVVGGRNRPERDSLCLNVIKGLLLWSLHFTHFQRKEVLGKVLDRSLEMSMLPQLPNDLVNYVHHKYRLQGEFLDS